MSRRDCRDDAGIGMWRSRRFFCSYDDMAFSERARRMRSRNERPHALAGRAAWIARMTRDGQFSWKGARGRLDRNWPARDRTIRRVAGGAGDGPSVPRGPRLLGSPGVAMKTRGRGAARDVDGRPRNFAATARVRRHPPVGNPRRVWPHLQGDPRRGWSEDSRPQSSPDSP